jgi:hypothetical protein
LSHIYKASFYQDRLGTNIGKTQKKPVLSKLAARDLSAAREAMAAAGGAEAATTQSGSASGGAAADGKPSKSKQKKGKGKGKGVSPQAAQVEKIKADLLGKIDANESSEKYWSSEGSSSSGASSASTAAGSGSASPSSPGKKLKIVEVDQTSSSSSDSEDDDDGEAVSFKVVSPKTSLERKLAEIDAMKDKLSKVRKTPCCAPF